MYLPSIIIPAFLAAAALGGPCKAGPPRANPTATATAAATTTATCSWPSGCLSDAQATAIVNGFKDILTNPDRQAANATAQTLIADGYDESSDSINSLAGFPLGSITFAGKAAFIVGVVAAPAIPSMQTLDIFHDCTKIAFSWVVTGLGLGTDEVKGINLFTTDPSTGQIVDDNIEFNSIAWGADTGYTTIPPGGTCPAALCAS